MFIARVVFLGPEKGGRRDPPQSGYHPQLAVGGASTCCAIESLENDVVFAFDRAYVVCLRPLDRDRARQAFAVGSTVQFYEGNHLVGSGVILEVVQ
jgi:hypothetical protein